MKVPQPSHIWNLSDVRPRSVRHITNITEPGAVYNDVQADTAIAQLRRNAALEEARDDIAFDISLKLEGRTPHMALRATKCSRIMSSASTIDLLESNAMALPSTPTGDQLVLWGSASQARPNTSQRWSCMVV